MKIRHSAPIAFLFLAASLLHTHKLMAAPAVPPGACLYALDPTADRAFQIAGAQSVYTACGVVSESSASSAFWFLSRRSAATCVMPSAISGRLCTSS